jgi:hypothetical protein
MSKLARKLARPTGRRWKQIAPRKIGLNEVERLHCVWEDAAVEAASKLYGRSAIIDGKVVVLDAAGRSDFYAVKTAIGRADRGWSLSAFDSLRHAPGSSLLSGNEMYRWIQVWADFGQTR